MAALVEKVRRSLAGLGGVTVSTLGQLTDLEKVDTRLGDLYREAVATGDLLKSTPILKATHLNLVAYTASFEDAEQASSVVAEVVGQHPCRSVVVEVAEREENEPPGSVSVVCGITSRGDRQLCGEIIRLKLQSDLSEFSGSVLPLLASDVLTYLWLARDLPEDPQIFEEVLENVDVVVLDSRRFSDLERGLEWIKKLTANEISRVNVQDLAWFYLQPWMEFTAQHFDAPSARVYLNDIHSIAIGYSDAGTGMIPVSALLFASWLCERLKIKLKTARLQEEIWRIQGNHEGREVDIYLLPEKSDLPNGALTAVNIRCGAESELASFVSKSLASDQISITEQCPGVCLPPRVLSVPGSSDAELLSCALEYRKTQSLYVLLLNLMQELLHILGK